LKAYRILKGWPVYPPCSGVPLALCVFLKKRTCDDGCPPAGVEWIFLATMSLSNHFAPFGGLLGGSLIGLSASTLLLFNGDILGASGLCSSFLSPIKTLTDRRQQWKLSFIAAFALTTRAYVAFVDPDALTDDRLGFARGIPIVSELGFIVGGLLTGFGTRLGNGCTTGHGICGLARLSRRSLAAVLSFMSAGIMAASGCSPSCPFFPYFRTSYDAVPGHLPTEGTKTLGAVLASLVAGAVLPGVLKKLSPGASEEERSTFENSRRKILPSMASAALFSLGLVVSKMTVSSKIYDFLNLKTIREGEWDPTLVCVMGSGLLVSFISYQFVKGWNVVKSDYSTLETPLCQKPPTGQFSVPTNKSIDKNLLIGEIIFGLGWGVAGLCPGPAMFLAFTGYPKVLLRWFPSFFVGSWLAERVKSYQLKRKAD